MTLGLLGVLTARHSQTSDGLDKQEECKGTKRRVRNAGVGDQHRSHGDTLMWPIGQYVRGAVEHGVERPESGTAPRGKYSHSAREIIRPYWFEEVDVVGKRKAGNPGDGCLS